MPGNGSLSWPGDESLDLVVSHLNADFDCIGSIAGALRLYPSSVACFPGSQEQNLREFCYRYPELLPPIVRAKDMDLDQVSRLILVDCQQASRIGRFAELLSRSDLEIHIYDHHPSTEDSIAASGGIVRPCGATATIIAELLQGRNIGLTPSEATLLLLGIHEDTGHLLFPTTTPEDYRAAAWLLDLGARLDLADDLFSPELTSVQVELLHDLISTLKTREVDGVRLSVAHAVRDYYVGDLAALVHMVRDMENLDVLVLVVQMGDRIYMVARSRIPDVDVGDLLRNFGGGGHPSAASATVKGSPLHAVLENLGRAMLMSVRPRKTVGQVMSSPVQVVGAESSVSEAREMLVRYNYSGMPVVSGDGLVGVITRKVAEKTVYHGLGDRPVTEFMNTGVMRGSPDLPLSDIMEYMAGGDRRFLPVFEGEQLVGVVTRTDLLRHLQGPSESSEMLYDVESLYPEPKERDIGTLVRRRLSPETAVLLEQIGEMGDELGVQVYAVGGFVRDLLINAENLDIDVTVEGDGIFFAEEFSARYGARSRPHAAFGTAVIVLPDGRKIDMASTRLEYYESPGVLPTVERGSLRHDLYRRDFTINTLALCLNRGRFGILLDFYGGQKDLQGQAIRVLHNLSFVEDPTRLFRAVRFEQRLGFRIEPHTDGLLRSAVRMGLVERVGGKRLLEELKHILDERKPAPAVGRMSHFGLLPSIHPSLRFGSDAEKLFGETERVLSWYNMLYLGIQIERWAVWFLALANRMEEHHYLELCQRLGIPARLMARIFSHRHGALRRLHGLRQAITRSKTVKNSQIYARLVGIPHELLIYGLARSGHDELRKVVSHYLARIADTSILLTGNDLKQLGATQGPQIRAIKERLLVARLDGEVSSRDEEIGLAGRLIGGEKACA